MGEEVQRPAPNLKKRLLLLLLATTAPFYAWLIYSTAQHLPTGVNTAWPMMLRYGVEFVLLTTLVYYLAHKGSEWLVLHQINSLKEAARRLAKGEFDARSGLPHDDDAFGQMARHFDDMAENLQGVTRAIRTLSSSNQLLLREQDEEKLLQRMCEIAVGVGGYLVAWVGYAQHDEGKSVKPMAHAGNDNGYLSTLKFSWADAPTSGNGITGTTIREGVPRIDKNLQTNPRYVTWRELIVDRQLGSACSLPLTVDDQTIGALTLYARANDAFDPSEMEVLSKLAQDLAFGIRNLRHSAEQKKAAETIRYLSHFDTLTGLANQVLLAEHMKTLLAQTPEQNNIAFLLFHIERFDELQDALGFHGRDEFLCEATRRLRHLMEPHGMLGRLMGDHFGLILPGASKEEAIHAARQLLRAFYVPFKLDGLEIELNAHVGIALSPEHGNDADTIIRRAANAARQSAQAGTDFSLYRGNPVYENPERLALIAELRRAIEQEQLVLHYQPKVDTRSRRVTGAEALVRWRHPKRGMVPPLEFIGLAEQTGLIKPLTYWVLGETVRQCKRWRDQGFDMRVAINLSARNLRDSHLLSVIKHCFESSGTDHRQLQIEITESVLMEDQEMSHDVLSQIKALGVQLYIDDFGTGYSSLGYLGTLPVHALKIDRSFINGMEHKADMRTLVSAILTMSHNLGLTVVAEGVETKEQLDILFDLGCDEIQGYYFSKPLPAEEFHAWCLKFEPETTGVAI